MQHFIEILKQELEVAMALIGITDLSQCDSKYVNTAELDWMVVRGEGHPYASGRRLGSAGVSARARL